MGAILELNILYDGKSEASYIEKDKNWSSVFKAEEIERVF